MYVYIPKNVFNFIKPFALNNQTKCYKKSFHVFFYRSLCVKNKICFCCNFVAVNKRQDFNLAFYLTIMNWLCFFVFVFLKVYLSVFFVVWSYFLLRLQSQKIMSLRANVMSEAIQKLDIRLILSFWLDCHGQSPRSDSYFLISVYCHCERM